MKRARSFMKYRMGSRDANHAAIRDGLRKLGHFVVDLAGCGDGVPDLCVYPRVTDGDLLRYAIFGARREDCAPVWLEVKAGKGKLRESQLKWRASAEARGIRVATVRTLDEALAVLHA